MLSVHDHLIISLCTIIVYTVDHSKTMMDYILFTSIVTVTEAECTKGIIYITIQHTRSLNYTIYCTNLNMIPNNCTNPNMVPINNHSCDL